MGRRHTCTSPPCCCCGPGRHAGSTGQSPPVYPCARWHPRYLLRPPCAGSLPPPRPWDALAGEPHAGACCRPAPAWREGHRAAEKSACKWRIGGGGNPICAHCACAMLMEGLTSAPCTALALGCRTKCTRVVVTARKRVQSTAPPLLSGGTSSTLGFRTTWHCQEVCNGQAAAPNTARVRSAASAAGITAAASQ